MPKACMCVYSYSQKNVHRIHNSTGKSWLVSAMVKDYDEGSNYSFTIICAYTHTHTRVRACMHARTYTHIHTHTPGLGGVFHFPLGSFAGLLQLESLSPLDGVGDSVPSHPGVHPVVVARPAPPG